MLRRTYDQRCSVARTLEVVGERWTLLIVREALHGVTRFDRFLDQLAIARNVLTDRLHRLVEHGVLDRVPYQDRPVRHEYRITPRGRELATVVTALMEWGDRHLADEAGPPRVAEHAACGGQVATMLHCSRCSHPVSPGEVITRPS
ncbi:DNA-binding HxlR family transcriptional regulator [Actinoalloteichus hoggarensis]|uniref:winged helix-turn-helix transcriptional regulator n=1 Tax=Actinoalloteichus hoggarensis TaxID=1470176 RepID=UPI000B8B5A67|nr:helix-turn-helix domain-containing protein [Actinoalloteichus hoggarensis]MBB5920883.1 DNA-binding HxlR family transcriptional regulator [Actinoalloteichus hoggarensis]